MDSQLEIKDITRLYKDEWVLLISPKVEKAKIKEGKVVFHSKDRGEVHRKLQSFKGNKALVYTGKVPENVEVIL
ncbi:MAG: hypothetical protein AB1765_05255 [Candidatus Hydrogenedentota bacterium]